MIDAGRPWLAPLQPGLDRVLADRERGATVAEALNRVLQWQREPPWLAAGTLRFVPQAELPAGEAYESFIHRTARVPTRDNLHDLLNGLVWTRWPALKRRLNALQAAAIARDGVSARRGSVRDALTLFDENGALLEAPATLTDALRRRDWEALFITQRAQWAEARLTLVGHALLEKLATAPRKTLTAHVLLADPLALDADDWAAKPFCPLPVLGVPGWWPDNDDPAFYRDLAVFRPPRSSPADLQAGKNPSIDRYRSPVS